MTRRPTFWLVLAALALAGAATGVLLFSTALPSIAVEIRMDRGAAIDSATALATRYSWGAPDDRSAATFGLADAIVQTFVELEGGGPRTVERLADDNVYHAYQWRVRRFAEGRVEESLVRFTPAGEPYGFRLRLAEDDPGTGNVDAAEARGIAEGAAGSWGVDLAAYEPSESSSETLPGGRVDHTFVYERSGERMGEARFLLRMVVAGGRASELTHFVRVPEAFSRRYADMRSTNDTIALVAQTVLFLVFVLLGAGVGSALLLRQRWLEWRAPLAWGAAIAVLFGAATINQLPLAWTAYDTALSSTSFVVQQIAGGLAIAVLGTPLIAFFLLAGESLGRKAFPGHVQQWRFWSPEVASSTTALGMTVAAYLLVGLQLGYVVLFYLGTQELEGWWSPADALVQPDLLATYLPWLEAVSLSFFASFWEESVFRAVPIACAALLGARFGRRGLWIWGTVVVQAVVFAAGHANYPQQPPYARVIELTAPALLWGAVYVFYGLVPTIIAHFLYDLSLVSIVLFESNAPLDQGVIVAVGLLPLAVVLVARRRHGARARPPESAYNGAWVPTAPTEADVGGTDAEAGEVEAEPSEEAAAVRIAGARRMPAWGVAVAWGIGVTSALAAAVLRTTPATLEGDRGEAVAAATSELAARGVDVADWDVHVTTATGATPGRNYVFEVGGPGAFSELEGVYFGVPRWVVRFVDWDADPAERVEEYRGWVRPSGEISRLAHTLPEARAGAALDGEAARSVALEVMGDRLGLNPSEVVEVEAEETSRPNRTDWLFTFTEVGRLTEIEGEARIQVRIAGDEVVDVARVVHVPEAWERERRRVQSRTQIMTGGLGLLLLIGFGAAAVTAVVVWSRRGLPASLFWKLTAAAVVALLASSANDWPSTAAAFTTAQPRSFQVGATLIALALLTCVAAPAIGLIGALGRAWLAASGALDRPRPGLAAAPAVGLAMGGLSLLAPVFVPRPEMGNYFSAASLVPALGPPSSAVPPFLLFTCAVLVLVAVRERFGEHRVVTTTFWSLVVVAAVVLVPVELQSSAVGWAVAGLVVVAVLGVGLQVCAMHPVLVPGIVGTALAVRLLGSTWTGPYSGARLGGVLAVVLLGALAWAWTRELAQSPEESRASVGSE